LLEVSLLKRLVCVLIFGLISFSSVGYAQQSDDLLDLLPAILSGVKKLPRPIDFKVALPLIPAGDEYVIELDRWNIPNNRSQPVKTTNNLQAAIDWAHEQGYNRVHLPDGQYLIGKYGNAIYQAGIVLYDNTQFTLSDNAVLEMHTNNKWNYCVIAATQKTNIIIRGGTIKGDRATHIFTPRQSDRATAHDEGHGICISRTTLVLVEKMRIKNLTGDGLLLVSDVSDVTIRNNNISNNRRQGVSVVGGRRINIERNEIHHIRGTSPQFGVYSVFRWP